MDSKDLVDSLDPTKAKCNWCGRYRNREDLFRYSSAYDLGLLCSDNEKECDKIHYQKFPPTKLAEIICIQKT